MPPARPARISLPDRYRVVRHLASGGMASVWEAHDELLDRDVAVKLLAPHLGTDDRARRRFQREARAAAGLSSHLNVVTIYDVGEHDERVFMVMEIMRGGSVADRLRAGAVPRSSAVRWLSEAGSGLDAAHAAGIVHRDIKPGNLLLDGRDRLAVADFGIARVAWEDQLTLTGQVLGTAAYLSPEQALGDPATPASDRYALAVVAYELLTGARPFDAEHFAAQARAHVEDPVPPASSRADGLSQAVDAALERGLAKDPRDRWPSSAAFVEALERTLRGEETKPTRRQQGKRSAGAAGGHGDGAARGGRDGGRWRAVVPLLFVLVALAAGGVAAAALLSDRGGEAPRAERTPGAEATEEPEATSTAEPTPTASPEPTSDPAEEAPSGEPDLGRATALQVEGYNARQNGDYETALAKARAAREACGAAHELSPCGYALYEEGVALLALGQTEAAIAILEQRLAAYGDNESGAVRRALREAHDGGDDGGDDDD